MIVKKIISIVAIVFLFFTFSNIPFSTICKPVEAANATPDSWSSHLFISASAMPYRMEGLKNIEITDYYNDRGNVVGTKGPGEGRLSVGLEDYNKSSYTGGINVGLGVYKYTDFGFLIDSGFYWGDSLFICNVNLGFEYRLLNFESFFIGVMGKAGWIYADINLSNTKEVAGFLNVMDAYEDGITTTVVGDGEKTDIHIHGVNLQALVTLGIRSGDGLEYFIYGGVVNSWFKSSADLRTEDAKLLSGSKQIVTPGTYNNTVIKPKISHPGAIVYAGVSLQIF